ARKAADPADDDKVADDRHEAAERRIPAEREKGGAASKIPFLRSIDPIDSDDEIAELAEAPPPVGGRAIRATFGAGDVRPACAVEMIEPVGIAREVEHVRREAPRGKGTLAARDERVAVRDEAAERPIAPRRRDDVRGAR